MAAAFLSVKLIFPLFVADGVDENLENFGKSLISMENLDRSSPEMWPETGMTFLTI